MAHHPVCSGEAVRAQSSAGLVEQLLEGVSDQLVRWSPEYLVAVDGGLLDRRPGLVNRQQRTMWQNRAGILDVFTVTVGKINVVRRNHRLW